MESCIAHSYLTPEYSKYFVNADFVVTLVFVLE